MHIKYSSAIIKSENSRMGEEVMEFRQLKYFLALANHKNFSHAAEYLHVTQPTLSQQIKELETELGVTLFVRTNRITELTAAGHAFLKEAILLNEQYSKCLQSVSAYLDGGRFFLGKVSTFEPDNLLYFINQFVRAYPSINVKYESFLYQDILAKLKDYSIDAAFMVIPNHVRFENMEHVVVGHDRLSVIIPNDSKYSHISSIEDPDFKELLTTPMILHKQGYYYGEVIEYLSALQPNLDLNFSDSASIISIGMSSRGGFSILHEKWFFSYLPREQYKVIPLPDEYGYLQVSFIYNRNNANPCIYPFLQEIKRSYREKKHLKFSEDR